MKLDPCRNLKLALGRFAIFAATLVLFTRPLAAQSASSDSRWAVQFPSEDDPSFKRTECHSLRYFQSNLADVAIERPYKPAGDQSSAQRVGEINGFVIYDVIHRFTVGEPPNALKSSLKIILVQRKPDEFCEIYQEDGEMSDATPQPSYIEHLASDEVLVSRDPDINGNGGIVVQAYWTFDEMGPISIDFESLISSTLHRLVPEGTDSYTSMGFSIEKMVYDNEVWKEADSHAGPSGGHITIQFALKNHRPVVVSAEVKPHLDN